MHRHPGKYEFSGTCLRGRNFNPQCFTVQNKPAPKQEEGSDEWGCVNEYWIEDFILSVRWRLPYSHLRFITALSETKWERLTKEDDAHHPSGASRCKDMLTWNTNRFHTDAVVHVQELSESASCCCTPSLADVSWLLTEPNTQASWQEFVLWIWHNKATFKNLYFMYCHIKHCNS